MFSRVLLFAVLLRFSVLTVSSAYAVTIKPGDILVVDVGHGILDGALYKVDPVTGDRTMISGPGVGQGLFLSAPIGVAVDAHQNIYVTDSNSNSLFRIDAATGDRTIFSASGVRGTGNGLEGPAGVTFDSDGSLLIGTRGNVKGVMRIDPVTGDRIEVGPLNYGLSLTPVSVGGSIYVGGSQAIDVIDPLTNVRSVFSSAALNLGSGPEFPIAFSPGQLILAQRSSDAIIVNDPGHGFYQVDLATGNRSILADDTIGTGPTINAAIGLARDGTSSALTVAANSILRVDLARGDRTILSDATHGIGPNFISALSLAIVPVPEPSAFALAAFAAAIFAWRKLRSR